MAIISNGTTIADAGAFSVGLGAMTLIKTITISSGTSTVQFAHGSSSVVFDNTYPIYLFQYVNIHPATDAARFTFQGSTNTGSSYGITITTTAFSGYHGEDDSFSGLAYNTAQDLAQSTDYKQLLREVGSDNDQCCSGVLHLFNPSSTTFVKHFLSRASDVQENNAARDDNTAGYFNTTSAIDAIQFKFSSGNIDAGTIKLYGIKDS